MASLDNYRLWLDEPIPDAEGDITGAVFTVEELELVTDDANRLPDRARAEAMLRSIHKSIGDQWQRERDAEGLRILDEGKG